MQKFWHILNHSKFWSWGLIILLFILGIWYGNQQDHTDTWWQWIDPVAGIMTFITTLVIFGFQARKNWEDSLEKQLFVNYYYIGLEYPILSVQNAYLAGEGDIRAWAQALGRQVLGDLEFDMNWDDPKPNISFDSPQNHYIKLYKVNIYLSTNPLDNESIKTKSEAFLLKTFKHSKIEHDKIKGTIIWKRI